MRNWKHIKMDTIMVTNSTCKHMMEEERLVQAGGWKEYIDITNCLNGRMYMADILWKTWKYVTKRDMCHP